MHAVRMKVMLSKRKTCKALSESGIGAGMVLPVLVSCSFPGILTNLSLDWKVHPGQHQLLQAQKGLHKLRWGHEKQELTPTAAIRNLIRTYSPH